MCIYLKAAISS